MELQEKPIEVEPFSWATTTKGESKLHLIKIVKRGIQNLYETSGIVKISRILDYGDIHDELNTYTVRQDYTESTGAGPIAIWFGCWTAPDKFTGEQYTQYVNPNYVHAHTYSDAQVDCECGGWIINQRIKGRFEHEESCTKQMKLDASKRLYEKRCKIIKEAANNWIKQYEIANRLGVSGDGVSYFVDKHCNFDFMEEYMNGQYRTIATWRQLQDEHGHTRREISNAFGVPFNTVESYLDADGNTPRVIYK